jgi:osmoprotectant transport system permease protein
MMGVTIDSLLDYVVKNHVFILKMTGYHILFSGVAILAATAVGILLGILAVKVRRLAFIAYIANVGQSAPDLVVIALMIPLLGVGPIAALTALFIKGILPILRNTYAGIDVIDENVIEAGRGMGMTKFQVLYKIELSLALPIILASIRTASVIAVATITLAAYIGVSGLGVLITRGIAMYEGNILITGSILTAILGVCASYFIGYLEKKFSKWKM